MIIRGIDFARHNIVVGNDAESPTPGNAGQTALPPRGDLVARVIAVAGGEATLDINGQRMVVETHVALNAGDKLFVRVQEPTNGTVRLSILASGPDDGEATPTLAEPDLDGLLRDLGVPTDERTRQAARALVARDGTLDKASLRSLLADLKGFKQVTPKEAGAAALLQKAGMPVNAATVAVVTSRAQPDAPPQLAARLAPLPAALQAVLRQLPARSPLALQVQDALRALGGLPLDETATNNQVARALGEWLDKLQPKVAGAPVRPNPGGATAASAGNAAPARSTTAAAPAPMGPQTPAETPEAAGAGTLDEVLATLDGLATPQPDVAPADNAAPGPAAAAPRAPLPQGQPGAAAGPDGPAETPGKQAMTRSAPVSASQRGPAKVGITRGDRAPVTPDLATQLDRLGNELGGEHKELTHLIREAVAELRYTQLANGPGPAGSNGQEYLVPLLLPQLSPDHPEGRIQVYQRAARKGEPIDPNNVRFVFVLETEHMATVQADMTIKDGLVELSIGVPEAEDREMLATHLNELEEAIADLGWPTGRFGARQARSLPPRVRQEEGLSEVVRFDRRV